MPPHALPLNPSIPPVLCASVCKVSKRACILLIPLPPVPSLPAAQPQQLRRRRVPLDARPPQCHAGSQHTSVRHAPSPRGAAAGPKAPALSPPPQLWLLSGHLPAARGRGVLSGATRGWGQGHCRGSGLQGSPRDRGWGAAPLGRSPRAHGDPGLAPRRAAGPIRTQDLTAPASQGHRGPRTPARRTSLPALHLHQHDEPPRRGAWAAGWGLTGTALALGPARTPSGMPPPAPSLKAGSLALCSLQAPHLARCSSTELHKGTMQGRCPRRQIKLREG